MAPKAMKMKQVRASLGKFAQALLKKPAAIAQADDGEDIDAEEAMEEATETSQVMKKPAATGKEATVLKRPAAAPREGEAADEGAALASKKARILKKPAAAGKAVPQEEEGEQDDESAVASRKKELSSMVAADLKDLVLRKGLEAGNKGANVEAMLALEAREREAAIKKREQFQQVVTKHREDLSAKSSTELKELCEQKGLKLGGGKDDKVERLLEHAKQAGDIDRTLAAMLREARREELAAMDKTSLQALCARIGLDPLNKEVMVDRILGRESGK